MGKRTLGRILPVLQTFHRVSSAESVFGPQLIQGL